ncbi:septation ring formation regulator EzrA [Limosilactobacillus kribbianus]|uniref:septation ring formation regulator EzrA n=1 Tax=Limosilactobacillus kribbianus TaxID=2982695 RepID=UPI0022648D1F|nr:septation ring formation regulator EzrA [Limosilactobacillus kribbianus]
MFQILIVVLIVILLVLGGIVWYQRRILTQLKTIQDAQHKLVDQKLGEQLKELGQLQLTGDTKKDFDQLNDEYNEKIVPQLKAIAASQQDLVQAARTTKLLTIKAPLDDLRAELAKTTAAQGKVERSLNHLKQQSRSQQRAIEQIRARYREFHQQLNEKSFAYGESSEKLNAELADLEEQYERFVELTKQGDSSAAQEILTDLQAGNEQLAKELKTVPKLYRPLVTEFPDQLAELASGYATLTKQHYHFTEPKLDEQIKQLQAKLTATTKQLQDLHLDVVEQANKDLAEAIDHLYAVMQKELDARREAVHMIGVMAEFTQHAQHQNNELMAELDRLSLSYTLNNNEFEKTRELNEQIKTIVKQYNEDQQAIKNNEAVYSQILERQKENRQSLIDIEKEQGEINDEVAKLQTDEQRAKQMLQHYSVQIRTIRRQVEQMNLPGISQDYMDYFFGVSDEIKKLAAELSEYKVNMDNVTKQLLMVETDLERLQDKTNDLRDSAELTERLQQYANRFADNEKVVKAAQKSQELYNQYNYAGSLETIATALEEVEPGSYKRIEDSYYQEINEE